MNTDNKEDIELIRSNTFKGTPLGEGKFVTKLEKRLGRLLRINPVGRPKMRDN